MAFIQKLKEVFESLFFSSNPEMKNKMEFKKFETELKEIRPEIYKNSFATGNVGQAFFVLYQETSKISDVLSRTVCSEDATVANYFSSLLIKTGYHGASLEKLNSLSYENIKEMMANSSNDKRTREILQKNIEEVIGILNTDELRKIEKTLAQLDRLNEICNFKYIDILHLFSPDFNPNMVEQHPVFSNVSIANLETYFLDLLFLTSNYEITAAQGRAITVLAQQLGGIYEDERETEKLMSSLRKIAAVFNHILSKDNLQLFVKVIKQDANITFKEATYSSNKLNGFSTRLQRQISSIVNRIETELQDQKIALDTQVLFDTKPLLEVDFYNNENSNFFVNVNFASFLSITPLRIVKSFMHYYYGEGIQALLNDIVVEGFFSNPAYKTEFAQKVFACTECQSKLTEFETKFAKGNEYDLAVLKNWARESSHNAELGKRLSLSIESLNNDASKLLKEICTAFSDLYTILVSLMQEAHKVNANDITNIKMLFNSSRNRDNVELLEKQFDKWSFFIDIMKNYVIINTVTDN